MEQVDKLWHKILPRFLWSIYYKIRLILLERNISSVAWKGVSLIITGIMNEDEEGE